jgi:hypothetical protein
MTTQAETNPKEVLERRRLFIYKAFLLLAILNNGFLAGYCLIARGGGLFAQAPHWAPLAIGGLAAITVMFAIAALAWKKWGIYGMTVAGVAAAAVAGAVKLIPAAIIFVVGTAFLLLIARHQWSRLE